MHGLNPTMTAAVDKVGAALRSFMVTQDATKNSVFAQILKIIETEDRFGIDWAKFLTRAEILFEVTRDELGERLRAEGEGVFPDLWQCFDQSFVLVIQAATPGEDQIVFIGQRVSQGLDVYSVSLIDAVDRLIITMTKIREDDTVTDKLLIDLLSGEGREVGADGCATITEQVLVQLSMHVIAQRPEFKYIH